MTDHLEDDATDWVADTIWLLEKFEYVVPLSEMREHAEEHGFPQAIIDGLDKIGEAICFLLTDGTETLQEFALLEGARSTS